MSKLTREMSEAAGRKSESEKEAKNAFEAEIKLKEEHYKKLMEHRNSAMEKGDAKAVGMYQEEMYKAALDQKILEERLRDNRENLENTPQEIYEMKAEAKKIEAQQAIEEYKKIRDDPRSSETERRIATEKADNKARVAQEYRKASESSQKPSREAKVTTGCDRAR